MPARPLWTCPRCGHEFVTANLWHSCGVHALSEHFEGKEPNVAAAFEAIVDAAKASGPVEVYAQKSRIVLQNRVRFASVITRKKHLILGLWLTHKIEHPLLMRYEPVATAHYPYFQIRDAGELDDALRRWIGEAYAHGATK